MGMLSSVTSGNVLKVTRGGIAKAKIVSLANEADFVEFMFNPYQYSISKSNSWKKEKVTGQNMPHVEFESGGAQSLTLNELVFDTLPDGTDVRVQTDKLMKMMMIDSSTEHAESGMSAPPFVEFKWKEKRLFVGYISRITTNFTLFDPDGVPLRCTVSLTMEEGQNEAYPGQTGASVTGAVAGAPRTVQATQGDRLDNIAAALGAASGMRELAESNNVDNPLNVPPGTFLNAAKGL